MSLFTAPMVQSECVVFREKLTKLSIYNSLLMSLFTAPMVQNECVVLGEELTKISIFNSLLMSFFTVLMVQSQCVAKNLLKYRFLIESLHCHCLLHLCYRARVSYSEKNLLRYRYLAILFLQKLKPQVTQLFNLSAESVFIGLVRSRITENNFD